MAWLRGSFVDLETLAVYASVGFVRLSISLSARALYLCSTVISSTVQHSGCLITVQKYNTLQAKTMLHLSVQSAH